MNFKTPAFWESFNIVSLALWPLSLLFGAIVWLRKKAFALSLFSSQSVRVPIIIVGNLRVGGTGKTPVVIALAQSLQAMGFHPGIISRGYLSQHSSNQHTVMPVLTTSDVSLVGDEPKLLAHYLEPLHIPVWISRNRWQCAKALLNNYPICDVIISDDGLQHYALKRKPARIGGCDIEIVVQDSRGLGNGFLLPAGPLRESQSRSRDLSIQLNSSTTSQTNLWDRDSGQISLSLTHGLAYQLIAPHQQRPLEDFKGVEVLAIAGIGHPDKFFTQLRQAGLTMSTIALPDHYDYVSRPLALELTAKAQFILMTEKDAVKCQHMRDPRIWVIPLKLDLPNELLSYIKEVITR